MKNIAIIADFNPTNETHVMTSKAIEHSGSYLNSFINFDWVYTEDISQNLLNNYGGFLIGPGSPYKKMDNVLRAIKFARENNIPILGTCGGFQHMVIEFARNVLGINDAGHEESNPDSSSLFISKLACSLRGRKMDISMKPHSKISAIYGTTSTQENYYCSFGVNPAYTSVLKNSDLKITGSDAEGEIRIIELEEHPFYIGTLFVPQTNSKPEAPHPIITGFLKAVSNYYTNNPKGQKARKIKERLHL
jgi:CTP synthase (UTP-ammonia lyase)